MSTPSISPARQQSNQTQQPFAVWPVDGEMLQLLNFAIALFGGPGEEAACNLAESCTVDGKSHAEMVGEWLDLVRVTTAKAEAQGIVRTWPVQALQGGDR